VTTSSFPSYGGPQRDFVGYGRHTPDFRWPDGARVVVNLVVNYEEGAEYSLLDGDSQNDSWGEYSSQVGPEVRDLGTEAHMEFGSRVGIWRLARLIDDYGINASFNACAQALERNPEFSTWLRERDHDVIGHGYRWTEESGVSRDEEQANLRLAIESFAQTTDQRIRGWMVRSFPSVNTRELLVEEGGFLYDSDSTNDELPYYAYVAGNPFLVIPYSKVYNDVRYLIQPTYSTPRHFAENLKLALDFLLDEAARGHGCRMMSVGLHARWSGQANRATAVREFIEHVLRKDGACFMRRLDIARFWLAHFPADEQPEASRSDTGKAS
jgi:peptidoglycan/xylan/chitin deacetylase (PgdA/CDA1 family)